MHANYIKILNKANLYFLVLTTKIYITLAMPCEAVSCFSDIKKSILKAHKLLSVNNENSNEQEIK